MFLSYFGIDIRFSARFFEKEDVTGVEHLKLEQKCSIILRPSIAKGEGGGQGTPDFCRSVNPGGQIRPTTLVLTTPGFSYPPTALIVPY